MLKTTNQLICTLKDEVLISTQKTFINQSFSNWLDPAIQI